jgi:hypothetical protein
MDLATWRISDRPLTDEEMRLVAGLTVADVVEALRTESEAVGG